MQRSSYATSLSTISKWEGTLVVALLLAIAIHLLLRMIPFDLHLVFKTQDIPLILIITVGSVPLLGQIVLKLLKGDLGADLLAAIALITAVYLEQYLAAALLMLMLASGQILEIYAMRKASSVLLALADRMPSDAHRKEGEYIRDVTVATLQIGDVVAVYPHEICPVDGVVIEGHGSMDESYLTGEPYRISKAPGSSVLSGAINGDALLLIRAEKLPSDSRYAKIMEVMSEAEQKRPRLRRLGDQMGAVFAPLSLVIALIAWYVTGDSMRFLAVLVIATPCPLLIAIPITLISAVSIAARRAIVIKDPTVLERLPTCRTAIFDKTGTLTYGQPELIEIITANEEILADKVLQQAASLERYSKHPLASAIIKAAEKAKLLLLDVTSISEKPGQGLSGNVSHHEIQITHRNKLSRFSPEILDQLPPVKEGLECIVLVNNRYAATFYFRDTPREEGHSFITHLGPSHHFHRVLLVSGDRESEVSYLASLLSIKETYAQQSPEQKLAIVHDEVAKAPTLFMGDGINDAPALAVATVGIAFGQHSNVTSEAAGAVIMENSLIKVDELLHISQAMRRIVLQSALGGMALSFIGMSFAAAGFIPPVMGALLQEVIDVLAILNALQLTWRPNVGIDMETMAKN